jgi:hypothetical protein
MKHPFLALCDYGQGGWWALVLAKTAEEIKVRFPELNVIAERPKWITDDYDRLLERRVNDIDKPTGLLTDIQNERK